MMSKLTKMNKLLSKKLLKKTKMMVMKKNSKQKVKN